MFSFWRNNGDLKVISSARRCDFVQLVLVSSHCLFGWLKTSLYILWVFASKAASNAFSNDVWKSQTDLAFRKGKAISPTAWVSIGVLVEWLLFRMVCPKLLEHSYGILPFLVDPWAHLQPVSTLQVCTVSFSPSARSCQGHISGTTSGGGIACGRFGFNLWSKNVFQGMFNEMASELWLSCRLSQVNWIMGDGIALGGVGSERSNQLQQSAPIGSSRVEVDTFALCVLWQSINPGTWQSKTSHLDTSIVWTLVPPWRISMLWFGALVVFEPQRSNLNHQIGYRDRADRDVIMFHVEVCWSG